MASTFAAALGAAITARNVSQADVARRLGISPTAVSQWTRGETVPGDPATVFRLETVLELEPGALSAFLGYVPAAPAKPLVEALRDASGVDPALRQVLLDIAGLWSRPLAQRILRDVIETLRRHSKGSLFHS